MHNTSLDGGSEAPQQAWLCGWMLFRCDEAMTIAKLSLPTYRRVEVNSKSTLNWLPTEEEKPVTLQRPNDCG